jgi:hypothetical protein
VGGCGQRAGGSGFVAALAVFAEFMYVYFIIVRVVVLISIKVDPIQLAVLAVKFWFILAP